MLHVLPWLNDEIELVHAANIHVTACHSCSRQARYFLVNASVLVEYHLGVKCSQILNRWYKGLLHSVGIFWAADMHIKLRKAWRGIKRSKQRN